jgi:hypothetical protein
MKSPHTGAMVVVDNYSEWIVELSFPAQSRSTSAAKAFMAWFDSLQGARGSFTYRPQGSGKNVTGKTLAATANAYTNEILVGGWAANSATGLENGDYLGLSGKLYRISSVSPITNGSGQVTVSIEPSVRVAVASGAAVNFANPTVTLRLTLDDGMGGYSTDPDAIYLDSIMCSEVL